MSLNDFKSGLEKNFLRPGWMTTLTTRISAKKVRTLRVHSMFIGNSITELIIFPSMKWPSFSRQDSSHVQIVVPGLDFTLIVPWISSSNFIVLTRLPDLASQTDRKIWWCTIRSLPAYYRKNEHIFLLFSTFWNINFARCKVISKCFMIPGWDQVKIA